MENHVVRPKVELLWLSTADQGKQLELNSVFGGFSHQLATIVADKNDESLWLEVYVQDTVVQIPLSIVKEAVEAAPGNVHSEAWYEKHAVGYMSEGLSAAAKAMFKRGGESGGT